MMMMMPRAAVIVARKLISIQLRKKLSWISIWISDNEDSHDISCQIDTVGRKNS